MSVFVVASTILAAALAIAAGVIGRTWAIARGDANRLSEGEAIFLVAYHVAPGGEPSPRYRDRLRLARELWQHRPVAIWCLGGLLAGRERTNAAESRRYLTRLGVPTHAIRTLDEFTFLGESVETIQEAQAAAELARRLRVRRLIVLSDVLQLAQVRLILSTRVDTILVASPVIPSVRTFDDLYYVSVRIAALLVTLIDRKGTLLGWLRAWRSGRIWAFQPGVRRRAS